MKKIKLMYKELNISFIDFESVFPFPLSELPACFRFADEKSDFPIQSNNPSNYCYEGRRPGKN